MQNAALLLLPFLLIACGNQPGPAEQAIEEDPLPPPLNHSPEALDATYQKLIKADGIEAREFLKKHGQPPHELVERFYEAGAEKVWFASIYPDLKFAEDMVIELPPDNIKRSAVLKIYEAKGLELQYDNPQGLVGKKFISLNFGG